MKIDVFAYNFPHWKTNQGLIHLHHYGIEIGKVWLQNRKELNVPKSQYRITPIEKQLLHPIEVCHRYRYSWQVIDHNEVTTPHSEMAVILGARILPKHVIDLYPMGIINIHPGILPGNRGLDNLKWSIIKKLPIGVTAHFIDHRIDMGYKISEKIVTIHDDDTIRDVYIRQRSIELELLINVLVDELYTNRCEAIAMSEKFSAVPEYIDKHINELWDAYRNHFSRLQQA